MMKRLLAILLMSFALSAGAQKIMTVSGEYIYYPSDTESYEAAKAKALMRAQLQILADTFGTSMSSTSTTVMSNSSSGSEIEQFSLGESLVRGEWVETVGEPVFERFLSENDMLAIKVTVKGKIREISNAAVEYDAKVLRNGTEDRFESTDFRSGDDLYFSFKAPVSGHLTIYLYDGNSTVYCLLPYISMRQGSYAVKGGERYILFSAENAQSPLKPYDVDEFSLTCERQMEINRIYCIFSPKPFTKVTDNKSSSEALPRETDYTEFQKWLSKTRTNDLEMRVKTFDITIKK